MKKTLLLSLTCIAVLTTVQAQISLTPSVLSSAGGHFEGENFSISWTLGELAVSTLSAGDLVLTQGFQQPYDLNVSRPGMHADNFGISVFPNPVGEVLRVRFELEQTGEYFLEIQDVSGRVISQRPYEKVSDGDILEINTSTYTPGIYYLRILNSSRQQVSITSLHKR